MGRVTVADSARKRARFAMPAACAVILAGCGSTVTGHPVSAEQTSVTRHIGAALATLLPEPAQFPRRYPAVVLPPEAAAQAAGDLTGAGRGAQVQPAHCAPPEPKFGADQRAVAVGTDDAARATVTVELARTRQPLAALRSQLIQCRSMRVQQSGAGTTVTTELLAAPETDAEDALGLRRTVLPDVAGAGLTQSMRAVTGQVGDVRITVTYMSFSGSEADMSAVNELFATAVRRVDKGA
ncbi:sensor domain-containing protein [Nocardia brasiliensis]|uniref:Sensor domain-containing protein n=1 Tax=Nocardia brasiliensis TaxID=37326 RepID=A0A6G9XVT5_NOCBR|nr:sensor domain-containing protein [Nocardia brasiliensis]